MKLMLGTKQPPYGEFRQHPLAVEIVLSKVVRDARRSVDRGRLKVARRLARAAREAQS